MPASPKSPEYDGEPVPAVIGSTLLKRRVVAIVAALRRALQEPRDAEADQERAADEQRRTPARELADVVHHVGDAALANLIRETPHLIAGHVDVRRQRFVLAAQLVAGGADHVGDAAKPIRGAILLLVNPRRNPLLDSIEQTGRAALAVRSAIRLAAGG